MFRVSLGTYRRLLPIPKSSQFSFSVVQRSIKDVISEFPKEQINNDISFSEKELAKVIKVTQCPDGRRFYKPRDHAIQEMPPFYFSSETQPRLLEEAFWQDESFEPHCTPGLTEAKLQQLLTEVDLSSETQPRLLEGDIWQNESFEPSCTPELMEANLQQQLTDADFQHSRNIYQSNFEDSSTLPETLDENEIKLSNVFVESETLFDTYAVQDGSIITDERVIQSTVQDHFHDVLNPSSSKKKVKRRLKSDITNLRGTENDIKSAAKKQEGKKKKSVAKLSAEEALKDSGSVIHSSVSKTKLAEKKMAKNKKLNYLHSAGHYKEAATAALNRQHMQTLKSYIGVCINTNMIAKAHQAFYAYRSKKSRKYAITDVAVYDTLLAGWAQRGDLKAVKSLFGLLKKDGFSPSIQSYASYLECLARNKMHHHPEVKSVLSSLEKDGLNPEDLFIKGKFTGDQTEKLIDIIRVVKPDFVPLRTAMCREYSCKLLQKLNNRNHKLHHTSQPQNIMFPKELLSELAACQMEMEGQCDLEIRSVNAVENISEKISSRREQVKKYEEMWRKSLTAELMKNLRTYRNKAKMDNRCISLEPYLMSVDFKIIVDIMLREIRFLAENCENFSPSVKVLHHEIGIKVMNNYFSSLKKKNKIANKVLYIYKKYSEYLVSPELSSKYSPRDYWELLKLQEFKGPTIDVADVKWSYHTLCEVGKFLYNIIIDGAGFNSNLCKSKSSKECLMSVFCLVPVNAGTHLNHQVRVNPRVSQMYREAELENLCFDVSLLPMVCPPRPWNRINAGGSLITHTPFVRLPCFASDMNQFYGKIPSEQLYPCYDSLNILSLCPWVINKPMLDLVIEIFRNNGCEELDIPVNPKCMPSHSEVVKNSAGKRFMAVREHLKKKSEMASLWFDCLYKLTIANYFRDKVFWFPHNLDFRGRVYPTPPHFNHLGSDMVRSILLFAEGKPLGENGLNWLKIHLINLTGFKKREPLSERLKFANVMMPEILDSADKPFTGKQWWKTSDEPWQTLACCKEVASAVRSPDPSNYISHFPVHQDGSCNGLQHYAALGRDEFGAQEVNLRPADSPRDVYSSVAALVEKERREDAATGSEIAHALEGFVQRKVVKQTVMTYVYGVTPYGAKLQILKQLKDISGYPEKHCKEAVRYLSDKIFSSIKKMFTATQQIQKWFTDCAEVITRDLGKPVEWVTPLGLPVIQPYHREVSVRGPSEIIMLTKEFPAPYRSSYETFEQPNVMKQKNAFPPNFIHSLDSSHMMLTSLFCHREGITFVSVHDCFWTHPCSVEVMNRVCREQFVALHSEPILEQLSEYFVKLYLQDETVLQECCQKQLDKLQTVLTNVPNRGSFKLDKVLNSVYFFS